MPNILLEVCCGSADDVIEAWKAGANRVELNSSLFHGGLTPTIGSLQVVKKEVPLPVMTMIRPRAGGFCYTPMEFKTAIADAQLMIRHGTDGLVFGFLNEDGTVDKARTGELAAIAGDKTTVFHRALDVTPDWRKALETLIGLGITRVLTSGQAPSVFYALDTIAQDDPFCRWSNRNPSRRGDHPEQRGARCCGNGLHANPYCPAPKNDRPLYSQQPRYLLWRCAVSTGGHF